LAQALSAGDQRMVAHCCNLLAYDASERRNFQEAERFSRQGLQVAEMLHMRSHIAEACVRLGSSLMQLGQKTEAKLYFQRGIKTSHDMGITRTTLILILTSIEEYFTQIDKPFAVALMAMLLANPACDDQIAGWTEKTIVMLKAELPTNIYDALWKRGSQWTLGQAVALILERLS
jgi:hypothetical protein